MTTSGASAGPITGSVVAELVPRAELVRAHLLDAGCLDLLAGSGYADWVPPPGSHIGTWAITSFSQPEIVRATRYVPLRLERTESP